MQAHESALTVLFNHALESLCEGIDSPTSFFDSDLRGAFFTIINLLPLCSKELSDAALLYASFHPVLMYERVRTRTTPSLFFFSDVPWCLSHIGIG